LQIKSLLTKLKNTFSSRRNIAYLLIALYFIGMVINSMGNPLMYVAQLNALYVKLISSVA
jgi:hypothetical protein